MKTTLILSTLLLAACTTTQPTPDQLKSQFCPVVKTLNTEIVSFPGVSPQTVDVIKKVDPIVQAVCSVDTPLDAKNLNQLLVEGMPLLLTVAQDSAVAASPQGQALLVALPIVQVVGAQILATLPK